MEKYYIVKTEEIGNVLVVCSEEFDLGEKGVESWIRNRYHVNSTEEVTKEELNDYRIADVWEVKDYQTYIILTGNYCW